MIHIHIEGKRNQIAAGGELTDIVAELTERIVDGLHEAGRRIINAPTIIPAEEGET